MALIFLYLQNHLVYIHFRQIQSKLTFSSSTRGLRPHLSFEATFRHLSPSPEFYVVELFVIVRPNGNRARKARFRDCWRASLVNL